MATLAAGFLTIESGFQMCAEAKFVEQQMGKLSPSKAQWLAKAPRLIE